MAAGAPTELSRLRMPRSSWAGRFGSTPSGRIRATLAPQHISMFSFFKRKKAPETPDPADSAAVETMPEAAAAPAPAAVAPALPPLPEVELFIEETAERPTTEAEKKKSWMTRLKVGLSKTSSNLSLL